MHSAADGSYTLNGLPLGRIEVRIEHDEMGTAEAEFTLVSGVPAEWNPALRRGLVLRGRAQDSQGQPLVGWYVDVSGVRPPEGEIVFWSEQRKTDSDGRFEIPGCPEYALAAELRLRCVSRSESTEETGSPPELTLSLRVVGAEVNCRGGAHTRAGAAILTVQRDFEADGGEGGGPLSEPEIDDDSGGGSALPWILGIGAVLVAAAVVVAVLLVTSTGDSATLGEPQIVGW